MAVLEFKMKCHFSVLLRSSILFLAFLLSTWFLSPKTCKALNRTEISGHVTYHGTPLCALVLANGQRQFSCNNEGGFHLTNVPFDANDRITLFVFCSGFRPYKTILTSGETDLTVEMSTEPNGKRPVVTITSMTQSAAKPGWIEISGKIENQFGVPLRALVLINGQHAFTNDPVGTFSLTVPVGPNGSILLYGFCDGMMPYKIFVSDTTVGQVLGPLASAAVAIYAYGDLENPLYSTATTDSDDLSKAGLFEIPLVTLSDDMLYVIKVTGGVNLDADADGVSDETAIPNLGSFHLVAQGVDLRHSDFKVNILTELIYQQVAYLIAAQYPVNDILESINQFSEVLIRADLNGDGEKDIRDLMEWTPLYDKTVVSRDWTLLEDCLDAIHNGESYFALINHIFSPTISVIADDLDYQLPGLTFSGTHAFVVDSNPDDVGTGLSLLIIDISDPSTPFIEGVAETPGRPRNVDVADNLAYVLTDEGLCVIDISDSANPAIISTMDVPDDINGPYDVCVVGDYAYVTNNNAGLHVVDVSNPSTPSIIGTLDLPRAAGVVVAGLNAYVTSGEDYLFIIDVADPSKPEILGSIKTFIPSTGGTPYTAIAVDDSHVFVPGGEIIDVEDPVNPVVVGSFKTGGAISGIDIVGDNAYILFTYSGLEVVDISTPSHPSSTRAYETPDYCRDLFVSGNYAYIAGGDHGFRVVQLNYPIVEYDVSRLDEPLEKEPFVSFSLVVPDDNRAYSVGDNLEIINISDPTTPYIIDSLGLSGNPGGLEISGGYAYIYYDMSPVLDIIDTWNPWALARVGSISLSSFYIQRIESIAVSGSYIFAGASEYSFDQFSSGHDFFVIDRSNPFNPEIVGQTAISITPEYMVVYGSHVYAASANDICVLDISDPQNAIIVNTINLTDFWIRGVTLVDDHIYVAYERAFLIYDISNPEVPVLVGSAELEADTYPYGEIAVSGNYACLKALNDEHYFMLIFDVSDPTNPKTSYYIDSINERTEVAARNGYFYMLDGMGRFYIMKGIGE